MMAIVKMVGVKSCFVFLVSMVFLIGCSATSEPAAREQLAAQRGGSRATEAKALLEAFRFPFRN